LAFEAHWGGAHAPTSNRKCLASTPGAKLDHRAASATRHHPMDAKVRGGGRHGRLGPPGASGERAIPTHRRIPLKTRRFSRPRRRTFAFEDEGRGRGRSSWLRRRRAKHFVGSSHAKALREATGMLPTPGGRVVDKVGGSALRRPDADALHLALTPALTRALHRRGSGEQEQEQEQE